MGGRFRVAALRGELWQLVALAIRDTVRSVVAPPPRAPTPVPPRGSVPEARRDPRRRFTPAELDWMIDRAGRQCECPRCHHRPAGTGSRCGALFDAPGVQAHGGHLVSHDEGGATDPVTNGAALCAPCNQQMGSAEFSTAELLLIARNRRIVAASRRR